MKTILIMHTIKFIKIEYHNAGGLWTVETSEFTKLGEYIIQGAEELGHKQLDINGETIEGMCLNLSVI